MDLQSRHQIRLAYFKMVQTLYDFDCVLRTYKLLLPKLLPSLVAVKSKRGKWGEDRHMYVPNVNIIDASRKVVKWP